MFVLLCRFISGFVKIKIFGDYPERFLNICAFNGITLWNIRPNKGFIFANISIKDFKKLHRIKKNKQIHLRIVSKRGLCFVAKPYLARKGIAVGLILFFVINLLLSKYIWNIQVVGNKKISSEQIIDYCKSMGIQEGTLSRNVDTRQARLRLLMEHSDLSWASFIIEGSHLTIYVSETQKPKIQEKEPANLVASKDGVVEKVIISKGKPVVKKNQAVIKGELLGSGVIEYSDGTAHFVRCSGKVLARTKRTIKCKVPMVMERSVSSERVEKRRVISVFGINVPLSITPVNFKHTKTITTQKVTNKESYIPIYLKEIYYTEQVTEKVKLTEKEALEYAENELKNKEKTEFPTAEIIAVSNSVVQEKEYLILTRNYTCIENIAMQEKIKINNVN